MVERLILDDLLCWAVDYKVIDYIGILTFHKLTEASKKNIFLLLVSYPQADIDVSSQKLNQLHIALLK